MSWRRKKEPWGRFTVKAGLVLGLMYVAGSAVSDRYRIGIDTQKVKCLPGYSLYLVDQNDRQPQRGEIFAFEAQGLSPFFEDGTWLVKRLVAVPGDTVEITGQEVILVNGEKVGAGLPLTKRLNKNPADFKGRTVLPEGQYWFMGTSDQSFDARYWGTVKREQIVGRSHPLV